MSVAVLGAGAFGTALAIAVGRAGRSVTLWARDAGHVAQMSAARRNERYIPDAVFPQSVSLASEIGSLGQHAVFLLAVPMQALDRFSAEHAGFLNGRNLVACAKGLDLTSSLGSAQIMSLRCPDATIAVLTGPGFASDIARGLPTALTLACNDDTAARDLQTTLSTPTLRLYRTDDVSGAELGGALKNVVAIAAGVVIGAGLGDSARAALMTRGYAEMVRIALSRGARAETLAGLSGFGDLVLTCTSAQSRNFRLGQALGRGEPFDPSITVEGVATARALVRLGRERSVDMPVIEMVCALVEHSISIEDAIDGLLSRPLKRE